MALNLFAVPAGAPFLDATARAWLAQSGDDPLEVANGLILTPTRRAARSLAEAFLRVSDGRALLLPRIVALGALDEAPLAMAGALTLPPAVPPALRLATLTRLILGMNGEAGAPRSADRAWPLARELASLMDEADRAEIDLAARLPDAADPAYAAHWSRTLDFLRIVTHAWPDWLAEQGVMSPAARQVALLNAQAAAWERTPPPMRVTVAGTTAGIPAVARLVRAVARLPLGQVLLPVLDRTMSETAWTAMEDSHAQSGLAALLAGLDATRDDVRDLLDSAHLPSSPTHPPSPRPSPPPAPPRSPPPSSPGLSRGSEQHGAAPDGRVQPGHGEERHGGSARDRSAGGGLDNDNHGLAASDAHRDADPAAKDARFAFLSRALLPAAALGDWQSGTPRLPTGLLRLKPRDAQEEADSIAMILREAAETPGRTAALVTPDRDLAMRVSTALLRHGIVADDSAGEKLGETPPAVFLRLLAQTVREDLAPVGLLALLKHPFAAAGLAPAVCRQFARALERAALRGPRPLPGLAGLRLAIEKPTGPGRPEDAERVEALKTFLTSVETCLEPALRMAASVVAAPADVLTGLIAAAERLATTDETQGEVRLWAEEEGEALATLLADSLAALPHIPDQRADTIPGLLDALLDGAVVRSRRALRGRGGAEHPRVFIWGPLEARLQAVDTIVLGSLLETVWPPMPEPGPWLSRPMRKTVGLPSPEEQIGQAAHDFLSAALAAHTVVLSCPDRRDGAPAVPARWLTRIEALLAGAGLALPEHDAVAWTRVQDHPADGPKPVAPPRPNPPVGVRPSRLSVTEIETWLRDPYAIHAKHILKLPALKPLDQETEAADYGTIVHAGVHLFLRKYGLDWPEDAAAALRESLRLALAETHPRRALTAWWEPRLDRIADWIAEEEGARRASVRLAAIETEKSGQMDIVRPTRRFVLTGRADRIERRADGRLAILDYKTGKPPAEKSVRAGTVPQLPLEAAMAAAGAFGASVHGETAELTYWHLRGGVERGKAVRLFEKDPNDLAAAIDAALNGLRTLIDQYDEPGRPYLAQPNPAWTPRFSDYAQLERVAEWAQAPDEAEEGS